MSHSITEHAAAADILRPLCVDLDGTLVKTDTLHDALLLLARQRPGALLQLPRWLLGGKAAFKREVAGRVHLDTSALPYNLPLLEFLEEQHRLGRPIYLTTGADRTFADQVAVHLGIFKGVLASDGSTNLTGQAKLDQLRELSAEHGFDYIGNAIPDAVLLAASTQAMVANPSRSLLSSLKRRKVKIVRSFKDHGSLPKTLLKAIRIHQWAKNILLFLPMLLAHIFTPAKIYGALSAFVSFSLFASATYILNDLLDIGSDRHHPRKRNRPFACGDLSLPAGIALVVVFVALGAAFALRLSSGFIFWLAFYAVVTLSYSLFLKRVALVDVIVLSGLYTVRILAGGAATASPISTWMASFSVFFFLSLAIVKRFAELGNLRERGKVPANGRGYILNDLEQLRAFGTTSATAAVVVFTQYISHGEVVALYKHSNRLWLIVPLMLLWLFRVWLLASRGELDEDPVIFAIRDRTSWLLGAGVLLVALSSI
jgi:4-hydroxybenzoate polyprenyltransferase